MSFHTFGKPYVTICDLLCDSKAIISLLHPTKHHLFVPLHATVKNDICPHLATVKILVSVRNVFYLR